MRFFSARWKVTKPRLRSPRLGRGFLSSMVMLTLFFFKTVADSENMPIRVANVHFAYVTWHVGRRPGDFEPLLQAVLINGLNVIHKDAHPSALV